VRARPIRARRLLQRVLPRLPISPKFAHRVVGYLEEEAIHSYTEYLKDIEAGKIENVPAPSIAIDYWRLPHDATLKDVVTMVRADEALHRDVNHYASVCGCTVSPVWVDSSD
jgi:ubiquinol oxidase